VLGRLRLQRQQQYRGCSSSSNHQRRLAHRHVCQLLGLGGASRGGVEHLGIRQHLLRDGAGWEASKGQGCGWQEKVVDTIRRTLSAEDLAQPPACCHCRPALAHPPTPTKPNQRTKRCTQQTDRTAPNHTAPAAPPPPLPSAWAGSRRWAAGSWPEGGRGEPGVVVSPNGTA